MPERPWANRPGYPLLLLGAATALVLLAGLLGPLAPGGLAPAPPVLAALVAVGAAGAFLRPSGAGAPTLGLGTAVLPPAIVLLGTVPAAGVAALCLAAAHPLRHLAAERDWRRRGEDWRSLASAAGWAMIATLVAGAVVTLAGGGVPGLLLWLLLPLWPLSVLAGRRLAGERRRADSLAPAGLEAVGVAMGLLVVPVAVELGWRTALPLLAAFALLALLAGHERLRAEAFQRRIARLAHVGWAGHRVATEQRGDIAALTQRLGAECQRVIPCQWLELALDSGPEAGRSWHVGPDGQLGEGAPEPPATPPPLPGVHRRRPWKVIDLDLNVEDDSVARLRLWCDPRTLRRGDLELLQQLQPQIALSVHQALLGRMAREDPLTGIATRRVLESSLQQAFERSLELGTPITGLMCDLDHFKKINDTHGHAVGDEALVAVARILSQHLRDGDLCSRFGGEEFTLLLDGLTGEKGLEVAERLRERVAATPLETDGEAVSMTVSVGVASSAEVALHRAEDLLELADRALYEAKRQGRNRCLLYLGEGRFLDPAGQLLVSPDASPAPGRPRIFT